MNDQEVENCVQLAYNKCVIRNVTEGKSDGNILETQSFFELTS